MDVFEHGLAWYLTCNLSHRGRETCMTETEREREREREREYTNV
jgi:hypothetical protein